MSLFRSHISHLYTQVTHAYALVTRKHTSLKCLLTPSRSAPSAPPSGGAAAGPASQSCRRPRASRSPPADLRVRGARRRFRCRRPPLQPGGPGRRATCARGARIPPGRRPARCRRTHPTGSGTWHWAVAHGVGSGAWCRQYMAWAGLFAWLTDSFFRSGLLSSAPTKQILTLAFSASVRGLSGELQYWNQLS